MEHKKLPCYCGHDCARCVTYRATVENNVELRKRSQRFYREAFGREIPLEQIRCTGGKTGGIFYLCKECPWMKCCKERKINTCSECPEYPCPPLADYIVKYVNKCNRVD